MQRCYALVIMGLFALVCVTITIWWRTQGPPLLLYVTTLPAEPGSWAGTSIAALNPVAQPCAPVVFPHRTLTDVNELRWSPKRDRIVYTTISMSEETMSLWVMKADGSERQSILFGVPGDLYEEQLSPHERYVAYIKQIDPRDQETQETWVWDSQDSSKHQVMTATFQMAWSPREEVMAIDRWGDGRWYVVRPDGTIVKAYDPKMVVRFGWVWSPDGRKIGFASDGRSGDLSLGFPSFVDEVYALDLATGQVEQISHSGAAYSYRNITRLSWSPDGDRVAFVADLVAAGNNDRNDVLFVLDLKSGREVEVADHVTWSTPVWSPDDRQLVFVSTKDGTTYGQMYRVDVDSGATVQITCDDESKDSLSW